MTSAKVMFYYVVNLLSIYQNKDTQILKKSTDTKSFEAFSVCKYSYLLCDEIAYCIRIVKSVLV